MARTSATGSTVRREAFVNAAQTLIQTRGYEEMSVQDVLDELDASRGAFYHYFESKQRLLEAVVDRMVQGALAVLEPMVADPDVAAVRKLEGFFAGIARFKAERRDLVLAITRVWISDDNAIVREKLRHEMFIRLTPLLVGIVRQGCEERVFTATSPDHTGRVLVSLMYAFNESAVELFLARQVGTVTFEQVRRATAANVEAFERILGLPPGSLTLVDDATLRLWFG
jgi:AcrR family transcriptional regulator